MAVTTVVSALQVQKWTKRFFTEYVRDSLFFAYMGKTENAVMQLIDELGTGAGKTITMQLITRLQNAGVSGDSTLEGNEEALGNFGHDINIDQIRNGVRVGKMEQKHTVINLLDAGRMMLKLWIMDDLRDDIIQALCSPNTDGVTAYASCTEAEKDAWLTANSDRVLFGAAVSNNASNDHSAALTQIDDTNDQLDRGIIRLAKRRCKTADRHIRPVMVKGQRELFVMFAASLCYRDLEDDLDTAHQNAMPRNRQGNPIWADLDLYVNGTAVREVPEMPVIADVGDSGTVDVGINVMCGAQSVGVAWGQHSRFATDTFDYGNQRGVAVGEVRGIEKATFNDIQNGVHTIYAAAEPDS